MLDRRKIEELLPKLGVTVLPRIDSTNAEAKRSARSGAGLPYLICANSQSAGRGRLGRSFYSPAGGGLYMSLAYEPKVSVADAVSITGAAAVAVCEALDELCKTEAEIKWVNDIYVGGRKVCGILTEAVTCGEHTVIIVGIGVNCTTDIFPDDIKDKAGSVGEVDRNLLAASIAERLLIYAETADTGLWLPEYRRRCLVLGKEITYTDGETARSAVAVAVDEKGGLIVNEKGKLKTLSTGEITVRIK